MKAFRALVCAAARLCKQVSDHAASIGGKPWCYLLVLHDEIVESTRLTDFLRLKNKE